MHRLTSDVSLCTGARRPQPPTCRFVFGTAPFLLPSALPLNISHAALCFAGNFHPTSRCWQRSLCAGVRPLFCAAQCSPPATPFLLLQLQRLVPGPGVHLQPPRLCCSNCSVLCPAPAFISSHSVSAAPTAASYSAGASLSLLSCPCAIALFSLHVLCTSILGDRECHDPTASSRDRA